MRVMIIVLCETLHIHATLRSCGCDWADQLIDTTASLSQDREKTVDEEKKARLNVMLTILMPT